jgi:hypothetical protein
MGYARRGVGNLKCSVTFDKWFAIYPVMELRTKFLHLQRCPCPCAFANLMLRVTLRGKVAGALLICMSRFAALEPFEEFRLGISALLNIDTLPDPVSSSKQGVLPAALANQLRRSGTISLAILAPSILRKVAHFYCSYVRYIFAVEPCKEGTIWREYRPLKREERSIRASARPFCILKLCLPLYFIHVRFFPHPDNLMMTNSSNPF